MVIFQSVSVFHQSNKRVVSDLISPTLWAVSTYHHPLQLPWQQEQISLRCPCLKRNKSTHSPRSVQLWCRWYIHENKLFLEEGKWESRPGLHYSLGGNKWIISPWSFIPYRASDWVTRRTFFSLLFSGKKRVIFVQFLAFSENLSRYMTLLWQVYFRCI